MRKLLFIFILLFICCSPKIKSSVQTYQVKKGEFHINVVETGEVQATKSINISSPAQSWRFGFLKITKIIDDGTEVSEGDTVIVFDPSEVQKAIIDANAQLEIARAELEKLKAEQDSKIQELEADLKVFEISHEISQIELELANYESDIKKKEIRLSLEQAKISLDKAGEEIENQKDIHVEEQHQAELKIKQLENNLEEANKDMARINEKYKAKGRYGGGIGESFTPSMQAADLTNLPRGVSSVSIPINVMGAITRDDLIQILSEVKAAVLGSPYYTGEMFESFKEEMLKDQDFIKSLSHKQNIE